MDTNDLAESPFVGLTQQLQSFGRQLGIHTYATEHAIITGNLNQHSSDSSVDSVFFHKVSNEMRKSLLHFALSVASEV